MGEWFKSIFNVICCPVLFPFACCDSICFFAYFCAEAIIEKENPETNDNDKQHKNNTEYKVI